MKTSPDKFIIQPSKPHISKAFLHRNIPENIPTCYDCIYQISILLQTQISSMLPSQKDISFLPSVHHVSTVMNIKQDKYFTLPRLKRIFYAPILDKNKQNKQRILLESCVQKKSYEEVEDETQQQKIKMLLGPKVLMPKQTINRNLVGKDAALHFYAQYKKMSQHVQKKQLALPQLSFPCTAVFEKTEESSLLPCCLGLVKASGDPNLLNLSNYCLGDKYICALAAGLPDAKLIERCFLAQNRITDVGMSQFLASISPEIIELDFSNNKITMADPKLLSLISEEDGRLQVLNLADNCLRTKSINQILSATLASKHLKYLNLCKNSLSAKHVPSICELIEGSQSLEQLYLGDNSIKKPEAIFNSLCENKTIKVFDFSRNEIGLDIGVTCGKSIASFISSNKTVQHLDLSWNHFKPEEIELISEALKNNKTIYGVHFQGSEGGYVDSKGFLIFKKNDMTLDSLSEGKFNSFDVVTQRKSTNFESKSFQHVCWICEGWYEQQFRFTIPEGGQDKKLVHIHFDFEEYEPRLISINEKNVKYVTMVPPKKYKYFFTFNGTQYLDQHQKVASEGLLLSEHHQYIMDNTQVNFKVVDVSVRRGKARKIVNQWHELVVKTLPRMTGLVTKKIKDPWNFSKSTWCKEWKSEDEDLAKKCFEKDWKNSKISNLVKNQIDQDHVKDILWKSYRTIKNIYRHFASWSPFGEVWAISSNPFTEFCQVSKIINKDTPLKIIDLTFITTNSMSGGDWKGNSLVPQRGLVRFQFMESLVRLSEQKFKKNGLTNDFSESVSLLIREHVEPIQAAFASDKWRLEKYFIEQIDILIKKYRAIFTNIYKKNSKLRLKPGEKPFMCLTQFKSIFERANLGAFVLERDIFLSFNTAMMTQVDELENERFLRMTEIQFIEAVGRCSNLLPASCCVDASINPVQFHHKFEWIIHELKSNLCSDDIKLQFPNTQGKSIFAVEDD